MKLTEDKLKLIYHYQKPHRVTGHLEDNLEDLEEIEEVEEEEEIEEVEEVEIEEVADVVSAAVLAEEAEEVVIGGDKFNIEQLF